MKKYGNIIAFLFLLSLPMHYGCTKSFQSSQKQKSGFAIVVDPVTLEKSGNAIESYKLMLEEEGLKVFIISDDWSNAEVIREELKKYYSSRPILEGAVFIGDVPIPHMMDAQNLASAYKRDQNRYPLEIAAIPSDRYYDDFNLEFEFIEKDSTKNFYYYRLTKDPHNLSGPTFTPGA